MASNIYANTMPGKALTYDWHLFAILFIFWLEKLKKNCRLKTEMYLPWKCRQITVSLQLWWNEIDLSRDPCQEGKNVSWDREERKQTQNCVNASFERKSINSVYFSASQFQLETSAYFKKRPNTFILSNRIHIDTGECKTGSSDENPSTKILRPRSFLSRSSLSSV